ncbi:PhaM family polyhydroxyalkanoate granule multifunctional regulatory protein [Cupriavidus sp. DL-D2]|uniref:PhaM family polyhydroxyalkanoate granule multifunctional regulatory protein n=1 Tax=Cupriavidus sp. DL-D2 TaxID=3144974 RepID=UPI003212A81F
MFGQIPDFSNSFDLLRRMWSSGSGMPSGLMPGLSAMTPPMDLDEVDKRIHDLKAVESWLQLNTNLLRTTIQGLEVQRATLVALQTFGNALSPEKMQSAMENVARAANAPSAHPAHHANPFETPRTVSEAQADAENDVPDEEEADSPPESAAETGDAAASAAASDSGNAQLPPNAALWWDLLQRQFAQIASSAAAASAAPFGGGMSGMPGMPGMPGFGGMAAGADGAEPASQAPSTAAPKPTARKATAKKPAAKKPAAKAPKKAAAQKTAPDEAK